jgi:hypothetical protein
MLVPFSEATNRSGIIQAIEDNTGTQGASSSSFPLGAKTRDVNMALAELFFIGMEASGRWKLDDTNQTDYPFLTFDLVQDQQDYSFVNDGSASPNQILDIHHVEVQDNNGNWVTLTPYDMFNDGDLAIGQLATISGNPPRRYAKTANGIFFDSKPSYNKTGGGKIFFSRTASYFTVSDTTKSPGLPDFCHKWLILKPSYDYCARKSLAQASIYKVELYGVNGDGGLKRDIQIYFGGRNKDERPRLTMKTRRAR